MNAAILISSLLTAAPLPLRVAVLIEDGALGEPAQAAVESALQARGVEVVSRELALEIRKVVTPRAVLEGRLPEQLSVLEADAILAGTAAYGEPTQIEGVQSLQVVLTLRLLDLATGRATATLSANGVGLGVTGPNLHQRGAQRAVEGLFGQKALGEGLAGVGQESGSVTLIVQDLDARSTLAELRAEIERTLGGAPAREIYFTKGVGKLLIGGSKAKSMNGPEVADALGANKALALVVTEVANTRIVARFERARAIDVHALVTEPIVPARLRGGREELGRFVAGELAKFGFVRASYQPTKLSRSAAIARARKLGAQVLVESEILGTGRESAFAIRIIDVKTGQPILREQTVMSSDAGRFSAAETMLAGLKAKLPEQLAKAPSSAPTEPAVASGAKESRP